jgi:hypothetical protein
VERAGSAVVTRACGESRFKDATRGAANMPVKARPRIGLIVILSLAFAVALVWSAPSLSRPTSAAAQGFCTGAGGTISYGGGPCGLYGGGGCSPYLFSGCGGYGYGYGSGSGYGYGCGVLGACSSCYGGYSVGCGGSGCGYGYYTTACGVYSTYGGCMSPALCLSAATCPTILPAGESCSGGVITCAAIGQTCSNSGVANSPSINCPGGTVLSSGGCVVPSASVTCTGSGVTAPSQSQCPTSCPDGTFVPTGQQCPPSASIPSGGYAAAGPYSGSSSSGSAAGSQSAILVSAVTGGWNLIGGPNGSAVAGASAPIFTFQAGDTSYETLASGATLKAGAGYWVDFGQATTMALPIVPAGTASVTLPPGQWVMIGNPGDAPAMISGADAVLVYDPGSGYIQTTTLAPGQGAWAVSDNGTTATISWGAPQIPSPSSGSSSAP